MSDLELVDHAGTVLFDFTDEDGLTNPFGLKCTLRAIDFGERSREAHLFSPSALPGGTRTKLRHGLRIGQAILQVQASSIDNLLAGVGELDRLLELDNIALRNVFNGQAKPRFFDLVDAFTDRLIRGEATDGPFKVDQALDISLGVTFTRQPGGRLTALDSDKNRLRNPAMFMLQTGDVVAGIPAWWEKSATFDNNVIDGEPTYHADTQSWEVEVDTIAAGSDGDIIQQRIDAAEGETFTFSIEAMRAAGAATYRLKLLCLDAAGAFIAGSSVISGALSDAAFTRRSVTKANLPAGTAQVIVILDGAGGVGTFRFRKAMLESGVVATDFVTSTEVIPANPSSRAAPPTAAPVAANAVNVPGSVNGGTRSYVYTNVDADGRESLPSAVSAIVTVDGVSGTGGNQDGKVNLSAILAGPEGTTARKVYRTIAGNTGVHKLLTTINDNVTTTYLDNIADASLGADPPTALTSPALPGRVLLVYNPGEFPSPVSFRVKADSGARIQSLRFAAKSFGGELASRLPHLVNGPMVVQIEDIPTLPGNTTSAGTSTSRSLHTDADASNGKAYIFTSISSLYQRMFRWEYGDVDILEGFRGPLRVTLRCRTSNSVGTGQASKVDLQLRGSDSMEAPAANVLPEVEHNTRIDGLTTFGYVLVDLGTISISEDGTLEGLTLELWAKGDGDLVCDCLILTPVELGSIVSLPYLGRQELGGEGSTGNIAMGNLLGANRWRVTWRYSVQSPTSNPGNEYTPGFRVRRDNSSSGTVVAEIHHEHPDPIINVTTTVEFDSVAGLSYWTDVDTIDGTGTITIHEVYVERVCLAEMGERFVTLPDVGEDRAFLESMDGQIMCEAFPMGPTPFWLEPGWSLVTVDPFEPRIGGVYAELKSEFRRMPEIGYELPPRVRQP